MLQTITNTSIDHSDSHLADTEIGQGLLAKGGRFWMAVLLLSMGVVLVFNQPTLGQDATHSAIGSERPFLADAMGEQGSVAKDLIPLSRAAQSSTALQQSINVDIEGASLERALREVITQTGFQLSYGSETVEEAPSVTLRRSQISVHKALLRLLEDTQLQIMVSSSGYLVLTKKNKEGVIERMSVPSRVLSTPIEVADLAPIRMQTGTITGTVTDAENGQPLPGVNIVLQGTQRGTASGPNGQYRITGIEAGTYTLRASFVGYEEGVQAGVQVQAGDTTTVNFALTPSAQALEELVVVGYGEQRQEDVTGSISQISAQDIEDIQATGPQEVLQGAAAGVSVVDNAEPGEGARVRIRGLNTLNTNNPLYVVDGVPVGGLKAVNPSNIESIEVLKDASAAAIYGSRASGGVVLISTKGGQAGDIQVDFSSSYGVQNAHQRLDVLNTDQYLEWATEMQQAGGQDPPQPSYSTDRNVDWQDKVLQTGYISNTNLAVSGGNESATYRLSLGFTDQKGTVIETGFERYSLRANSDFDLGRFSISENLSLSYREENGIRQDDILGLALRMPPYIPVHDSTNLGGFAGTNSPDLADDKNPVRLQELGFTGDSELSIIGNVTGEARIVEGVNVRSVLGMDYDQGFAESFTPPFSTGNQWGQGDAEINESRFFVFSPVSTTTLNVDQAVGSHQISGTAGFEVSNTFFKNISARGQNPLTDQVQVIGSVDPETLTLGGGEGEDVLVSYFGRLNYNYKGRYLLEGSLRRDGYSRFGPQNKWGLFPSVSAGWNVHEESFMEDLPISQLKIRGSWGLTGNNNAIGRYEWQSTISTNFKYNFNGNPVTPADINDLSNASLKWEQVEMINVGVDLGFLNNAVTFSTEYYQNTTEDILLSVPLPGSFGFPGGTRANTGDVESSGFEFTLGLENPSPGELSWSVDANFSTATNEMIDLGLANEFFAQNWGTGTWPANRVQEGFPLFHFWGFKVDRLFQQDD